MIRRAGDVIPQVVARLDKPDLRPDEPYISLDSPQKCPACGSPTVFDGISRTGAEENVFMSRGQVCRCGGPPLLCPPRAVAALAHAYGRDALDITGLSEARIQQLMDAGLLRVPADLFELTKNDAKMDTLTNMTGWGPKSVQNLADIADRVSSQGVTLSRFIYSLGIRFLGLHTSALLASIYGTADAFLKDIEEAANIPQEPDGSDSNDLFAVLREENDQTKGIGPVLLSSLQSFSKERELVQAAKSLAANIRVINEQSASTHAQREDEELDADKPFSGLSIVFTGAITGLSRTEAKKMAKKMGAKSTPTAISKNTDMVVSGAKSGKKIQQANDLGLRIVLAEEFLQIVEEYKNDVLP